jgi:hypothetical protein
MNRREFIFASVTADDSIETAVSDPLHRFPLCLISLVFVALFSFSEAALAQNYRAPRKDRHPRQSRYYAPPPAPYRPYQRTPKEQRIIDRITRHGWNVGR